MASAETLALFEAQHRLRAAMITQGVVAHEVYLAVIPTQRTELPENDPLFRSAIQRLKSAEAALDNLDYQVND